MEKLKQLERSIIALNKELSYCQPTETKNIELLNQAIDKVQTEINEIKKGLKFTKTNN